MEKLIDISGYANTYAELCRMDAFPGEFYNCLEGYPFTTYRKTDETELNYINEKTDIIGWYENRAELESNVKKPKENDVYIVGLDSPYTRYKAVINDSDIEWVEDGEEEKKILKNYKTNTAFTKRQVEPEEGIYYSVGKTAPYQIFGLVSYWEECGFYISVAAKNTNLLNSAKAYPGEFAFTEGQFWLYTNDKIWEPMEIIEPIGNVYKHAYKSGEKTYRLREGKLGGTLEWFEPRS